MTLPQNRPWSTQGHHLNKLCWAQVPDAAYQTPKSLALWFQRIRFLKGFYYIWAWRSSWSCDSDPLNKFLFPRPMKALHEIWLWLAQWFWRRRPLKMVDNDGQTDEGYTACLNYKLTYAPKGSGELKMPIFILPIKLPYQRKHKQQQ